MKYSLLTMTIIITLFLIAEVFGLFVTSHFLRTDLPYGLQPPEVQEEASPFFLITAIVIVTIVLFFLQRFKFDIVMKLWFFAVVLLSMSISLSALMVGWIAFAVALTLTMMKFLERDVYVHNIGEILIYGGVVSLFAPILNITTVTLLLIAIAVYDFIAVNITKHMVVLAKMQQSLGIFSGLIVVNKNEVAILGGGDIAFSLLFATVALKDFGLPSALFAIYGATIAIWLLMLWGQKKKFYPAMPFVTAGSLLGFLVSIAI
jgi:presenilin-like A22 family membrane protease